MKTFHVTAASKFFFVEFSVVATSRDAARYDVEREITKYGLLDYEAGTPDCLYNDDFEYDIHDDDIVFVEASTSEHSSIRLIKSGACSPSNR